MTRIKVRNQLNRHPLGNPQDRTRTLTMEQEQALGDLALIGGPAFFIGLWGLIALVSGLSTMATSIL